MLTHEKNIFALLLGYVERLVEESSDTDLARPIAANANPPAWILAHLAISTDYALSILGRDKLCPADWHARFGPGSSPEDAGRFPSKVELLTAIRRGGEAVLAAAPTADPQRLSVAHDVAFLKSSPLKTLGDLLAHLMTSHFSLHVGQLSAWRRQQGHAPLF